MRPDFALSLPVNCDATEVSLEHAALLVGPDFIYELRVSPDQYIEGKTLLKAMSAQYMDNPFSPYVNLVNDDTYKGYEWSLSSTTCPEKIVWNAGC